MEARRQPNNRKNYGNLDFYSRVKVKILTNKDLRGYCSQTLSERTTLGGRQLNLEDNNGIQK